MVAYVSGKQPNLVITVRNWAIRFEFGSIHR